MRAALYIRVSDDEQVRDGFSIEAQETLLRRKCAELKYTIVEDPYIDEGYSAKNMKRPYFQKLLGDIDKKNIQVIVFWRLDRFTRNSRDFQKVTEMLDKKGCGIKSSSENIDTTTAMGRFQLELTISLAQLERETTAERVHDVMEERHRKGLRNGAVAPYGYRLEEGNLIVEPTQAEIVREIYALYKKPLSTRSIAKILNQDPIKYPNRSGGVWTDSAVQYILTNPVYCGRLRWNRRKLSGKRTYNDIIVDADHEPILSVEEYEHVQAMRNKRFVKREKVSSTFHFTGVLRCARCGYAMVGITQNNKKTGKTYRGYRCLGRANYGICNMPHVREEAITEAFLNALQADSIQYKKLVVINESVPMEKDYEQETIARELESITRRRKKWQEAYANDAISLAELKSHMDEERAKEEMFKAKLEPAAAELKSQMSQDELLNLLSSFRDLWYSIEDESAKKAFIQEAFKEIVINTPIERGVARPGKMMPVDILDWKLNV